MWIHLLVVLTRNVSLRSRWRWRVCRSSCCCRCCCCRRWRVVITRCRCFMKCNWWYGTNSGGSCRGWCCCHSFGVGPLRSGSLSVGGRWCSGLAYWKIDSVVCKYTYIIIDCTLMIIVCTLIILEAHITVSYRPYPLKLSYILDFYLPLQRCSTLYILVVDFL